MRKYSIFCQIGSMQPHFFIDADTFLKSDKGYYYFYNSLTGQEWYLPIERTVVITNK